MVRMLLRWALLLTLLFALPVVLIRAQSYDDHEIRAFLTPPEGCPAPCFMGIRPGVTSAEEAVAILEAHAWVAEVDRASLELMRDTEYYNTPKVTRIIHWAWSAARPDWITDDLNSGLMVTGQQVAAILIRTQFRLGDMLMVYGIPENGRLAWSRGGYWGFGITYNGWYPAYCMAVSAGGAGLPREVYREPVQITLQRTGMSQDPALTSLKTDCG